MRLLNYYLLISVLAFLVACSDSSTETKKSPKPGEPINENELMAFVQQVEKSIKNNQPKAVDSLVDFELIQGKVLANKELSQEKTLEFGGRLRHALRPGTVATTMLQQGGFFRLAKVYAEAGVHHAIYSLYIAQSHSVNYIDFEIARDKNGLIKFSNGYYFATGQFFSDLASELLEDVLNPESSEKTREAIVNISSLLQQSEGANAERIFQSLPEDCKARKSMQALKVKISSQMGEQAYKKAVQDFAAKYPDDKRFALFTNMTMDLVNESYGSASQAITQMRGLVGNDPILDCFEADLLLANKQVESALQLYQNAVIAIPQFFEAKAGKLFCLIQLKQYAEAAKWLSTLKSEFDLPEDGWKSLLEEYPDFVASKEYKDWLGLR